MDAAVSLHHHGALALPTSLPPPSHRALPLNQRRPSTKPPAARLTLATRPTSPARSAPAAALPVASVAAAAAAHHSSRAATGYAAALADACVRAGRPATRAPPSLDARVAALVRMLVAKGKAGMVAEVLAEFAAICDKLLPLHPARAHGYY
ncbi:hypothetical protein EJB05_57172, partial [Eragrostis curvula]